MALVKCVYLLITAGLSLSGIMCMQELVDAYGKPPVIKTLLTILGWVLCIFGAWFMFNIIGVV